MKIYDSASVATAAFAGAVALVALAGCAQLAVNRHEERFATYAEASDGWVGVEFVASPPVADVRLRRDAGPSGTEATPDLGL